MTIDFSEIRSTSVFKIDEQRSSVNTEIVENIASSDPSSRNSPTNSSSYKVSDFSDETELKKEQPVKQMAPLFFFLASSLNVELVYSILKGITQFGYLTLCDSKDIKEKLSRMETENTIDGFKIIINRIKIKDCNNWNSASYQDFIQNNLV
jgi:hypothetical protein